MDNNTVTVRIGEEAIVKENVKVSLDCSWLIDIVIDRNNTPIVTWYRDDLEITNGSNIVVSDDGVLCIVRKTQLAAGGQVGTAGLYTCKVCISGSDTECRNETTRQVVCG